MYFIKKMTTPEQIAEVAKLAEEIWNQHFPSIIGQDQTDYMVSRFQSVAAITEQVQSGAGYYVIDLGGQSVGYMALVPEPGAGRMTLGKIYVKQVSRGLGLGKAMLDFAREQCLNRRCCSIRLAVNRNNHATIQWYIHQGFETIEKIDKEIGFGFVMNDFIMELPVCKKK